MKSGGGGGGGPGNTPQPNGRVTPYGQSTPFNPEYQSVLPQDQMQTAQLADAPRGETAAPTPLLQAQEAEAAAAALAAKNAPSLIPPRRDSVCF